ncbi:uncharacterized protein LOC144034932 [Vanacampus margaritifer]
MAPTAMKLRVRRRDNNGGDRPTEEAVSSRGSRRKKKTSANTQAAAPSPPAPSTRGALTSEEASPDSKCPICLDRFNNMAYLNRCLHRFCFRCIQEWSHNKAECPLCKQPFASILHSVRAEDDFKEYTLRPAPTSGSVAATMAMVAAMASAARSDHQLRLMLRRHRVADANEPTTRSRRRERGGSGRSEEEQGVWEWYLDVPPLPLAPRHSHEDGEQGGADLSERGVIFEGLSHLGANVAARASPRLVARLTARLRLQREGMTVRRLREGEMVAFRRALYRGGIRVRGVAGVSATDPQRDISVDGFRQDPGQLNRLRPWLRRELTVLDGANGSLVDVVQRIIAARMAHHGLEDAATMEEELQPFLLAQTEHFLHELLCFARSPLSLDEYDLHAAYHPPPADSSGSASSSVIAISEDEEEEEERRSDQKPGPSHSATLTSPPSSPVPQEDEGECMIVGYKKPMAERTPELVHLSSDSERSSPAVPPSTSAACQEKDPAVGSLSSICTPTPPPADKKKTKKKRSKRERKRKRGTLANPNRSIYPAMMRSFSHSSLESSSPLALSPPDCGWEISSTSSSSSFSSSSSSSCSPVCSSSPTPPSPRSPSRSGGEKPGGKRKYKSRHLDELNHPGNRRRGRGCSKRKSDTCKMAAGGDSKQEIQRERSPSVEIVYEGTVPPKRHRRTQQHGRAPLIITLDSNSSDEDAGNVSLLPDIPSLLSDRANFSDISDVACVDANDDSFPNPARADFFQVRSAPPPLIRAPPLKLQDEGTEEEEVKFSPPSSSLDFLSDLFQVESAAGGELSAPPSPSIMSCPL